MSHIRRDSANYEGLRLISYTTTRCSVDDLYSFAIHSLLFFLHSAPVAEFPVENAAKLV